MTMWEVEFTDELGGWFSQLAEAEQEAIVVAVEILQERGPGLARPLVGTIRQSRHANMKELIPPAGNLRILFAFDPRRMAILLIGGDKTGRWREWYEKMIPVADQLYDDHLQALRQEGK